MPLGRRWQAILTSGLQELLWAVLPCRRCSKVMPRLLFRHEKVGTQRRLLQPHQREAFLTVDTHGNGDHFFLFAWMILPGGGLRLQTSGGVKAQWFDSTFR